jgi:hypothetical protein
MTQQEELPVQFTHSLKVEDTAKGIRISVHIYTYDQATYKLYKSIIDCYKYFHYFKIIFQNRSVS